MHLGFIALRLPHLGTLRERWSEKRSTIVHGVGIFWSISSSRRSALVNKWEKLGRNLISTYARINKSTATDAPLIHELISHASMHITSKFVLNTMHSTYTGVYLSYNVVFGACINTNSCRFCIASSLAMGTAPANRDTFEIRAESDFLVHCSECAVGVYIHYCDYYYY